jgi:hypothetical protein
MRGVSALHIKQYQEYKLSVINNSGEFIKNCEFFLEFGAKFEKPPEDE